MLRYGQWFQISLMLDLSHPPGGSHRVHRPLPHSEGQPGGAAAPVHLSGPQAGFGAQYSELHSHVHRRQTGVVHPSPSEI